jgi:hypothetical protein
MNQSLIRIIAGFLIWLGIANLINYATGDTFTGIQTAVFALVNSLALEFLIPVVIKWAQKMGWVSND